LRNITTASSRRIQSYLLVAFALQKKAVNEEMSNLLAYLAKSMTVQTENLATEALTYILQKSTEARQALLELLEPFSITGDLHFANQVYTNGAIPDIVGFNEVQESVCIIEAKFWASLTDHQPNDYILMLPATTPSVLLFLAPDKRFDTLWWELKHRIPNLTNEVKNSVMRSAWIDTNRRLALISWRTLLSTMLTHLEREGALALQGDAKQLLGLCMQADQDAFLPLRSEELSPEIPRRLLQYHELVDEVVVHGRQQNLFNTDKLKASGTNIGYGRYFNYGGYLFYLCIDFSRWSASYNTPMWARVYGKEWNISSEKRKAAIALQPLQNSGRLFIGADELAHVAISLPLRAEKDSVINTILSELAAIKGLLDVAYVATP
jgi:hypothetical protein